MNMPSIGLIAGILALVLGGSHCCQAAPQGEGWVEVSNTPKLKVYCRSRPGTSIKEYQVAGIIAAPNWVVENVLADAESYPQFMPCVAECKILKRDPSGYVSYQRISAPMISDRDYVLRIRVDERHSATGTTYIRHWGVEPKNAVPERSGVVRIKINDGSWTLEPLGDETKATYCIYSDPGGAIPATLLNLANRSTLPKVFAAVEKRAQQKQYWAKP